MAAGEKDRVVLSRDRATATERGRTRDDRMTAPPAWYRAGQPSPARLLGLSIAVGLVLLAAACRAGHPLSRLPGRVQRASASYQWPWRMTSPTGRRSGLAIGCKGRSAG
jgi:hypothetical protein